MWSEWVLPEQRIPPLLIGIILNSNRKTCVMNTYSKTTSLYKERKSVEEVSGDDGATTNNKKRSSDSIDVLSKKIKKGTNASRFAARKRSVMKKLRGIDY